MDVKLFGRVQYVKYPHIIKDEKERKIDFVSTGVPKCLPHTILVKKNTLSFLLRICIEDTCSIVLA